MRWEQRKSDEENGSAININEKVQGTQASFGVVD